MVSRQCGSACDASIYSIPRSRNHILYIYVVSRVYVCTEHVLPVHLRKIPRVTFYTAVSSQPSHLMYHQGCESNCYKNSPHFVLLQMVLIIYSPNSFMATIITKHNYTDNTLNRKGVYKCCKERQNRENKV